MYVLKYLVTYDSRGVEMVTFLLYFSRQVELMKFFLSYGKFQ